MKRLLAIPLALFSLALAAPAVHAQQVLTGDEIKVLIAGKTAEGTFVRTKAKVRQYHAADGSAMLWYSPRPEGTAEEGSWHINGQGLHCTKWPGRDGTCAKIVKSGDEYHRVEGDTVRAIWHRLVDGNTVK